MDGAALQRYVVNLLILSMITTTYLHVMNTVYNGSDTPSRIQGRTRTVGHDNEDDLHNSLSLAIKQDLLEQSMRTVIQYLQLRDGDNSIGILNPTTDTNPPLNNKAPPVPPLADIDGLILVSNNSHVEWPKYRHTLTSIQTQLFKSITRPEDHRYNMNVTRSDMITLDRMVPDTRPAECKEIVYDIDSLPTASVIIPFYFEPLSMLLRTVHSILNRSPPQLLKEIILIDDANDLEYLQKPLWDYLKLLPKIKLIRHESREGLIRSRMEGARAASGDVIIFLDAHTEPNTDWLLEILRQIRLDPHIVVQPIVDSINDMTIEYEASDSQYIGAMSWDLNYRWIETSEHEKSRWSSQMDVIHTPSLVGCAIAVQRDYFFHIGAFDEGMDIWGGENIELSIRTWLCHGRVLTLPCSRVAHAFKEFTYGFGKSSKHIVLQKNLMRIADTYLDDYRRYFYAATRTHPEKRDVSLTKEERKTLSVRQRLRKDLQCKPFEWYIKHLIPNMPLPPDNSQYFGEITNTKSKGCWGAEQLPGSNLTYVVMQFDCYHHKILPNNYFVLTSEGRLLFGSKCVTIKVPSPYLILEECDYNQDVYEQGYWRLMHIPGELPEQGRLSVATYYKAKELVTFCVGQVTSILDPYRGRQSPQMQICNKETEFQVWTFTYKFDTALLRNVTIPSLI